MIQHSKYLLLVSVLAVGCGGSEEDPADNPPALGNQIDRAGRAAISTALIEAFSGDDAVKGMSKDTYNTAAQADWGQFKASMMASLAIIDSLDENCGNQLIADGNASQRYAALADVLVDDQLYVNSASGTCGVYLGLEAEIVGAVAAGAGGCGGRTLDDDVIERSYSVLAAGVLEGVDDTIAANDKPNSNAFPFLAAPSL